jgi:hypothetical protein
MSTRTIRSGQLLTLDPNDKPVLNFDWDQEGLPDGVEIDTYVLTITAQKQADPLASLTKDNDSLVTGDRIVQFRLLATTASVGDKYEVACKIITAETPAAQFERSFFVRIQNQ